MNWNTVEQYKELAGMSSREFRQTYLKERNAVEFKGTRGSSWLIDNNSPILGVVSLKEVTLPAESKAKRRPQQDTHLQDHNLTRRLPAHVLLNTFPQLDVPADVLFAERDESGHTCAQYFQSRYRDPQKQYALVFGIKITSGPSADSLTRTAPPAHRGVTRVLNAFGYPVNQDKQAAVSREIDVLSRRFDCAGIQFRLSAADSGQIYSIRLSRFREEITTLAVFLKNLSESGVVLSRSHEVRMIQRLPAADKSDRTPLRGENLLLTQDAYIQAYGQRTTRK